MQAGEGGMPTPRNKQSGCFASQPVCPGLFGCNAFSECAVCKQVDDLTPAMICIPNGPEHRPNDLLGMFHNVSACVACPVSRKELRANTNAIPAMEKEWDRLRSKGVWDDSVEKEWSHVCAGARKKNTYSRSWASMLVAV